MFLHDILGGIMQEWLYEDRGAYCFYPVCHSVILSPLWNFNLANNFWTVSARALIFHMSIPCDKTFLLVLNLLTLTFDLFFKIDIGHNF